MKAGDHNVNPRWYGSMGFSFGSRIKLFLHCPAQSLKEQNHRICVEYEMLDRLVQAENPNYLIPAMNFGNASRTDLITELGAAISSEICSLICPTAQWANVGDTFSK
ncbi:hypothetical protein RF11_00057 [Thelohanellus kitauei]|uniref:Uncharacterized protein n=1 Tax=Thelohanellus kitauei TaxID=669202 RepID=A0A0C2N355_THEKT|nr:hypothetical protein RF11_00057 [Thelohanellus kitauei]